MLEHSPLLVDADLVDAVATGGPRGASCDRQPCRSAVLGVRRHRRGRRGGGLSGPDRESAGRDRAVLARPHRRRATAISPPSARPCWSRDDLPAPTRQALVAKLSETLAGFVDGARMARRRTAPSASPRKPARRRPSRSPPYRPAARSGRSSAICARAASSMPGWSCARCCPAISTCSRRRWPSSPACRSRA